MQDVTEKKAVPDSINNLSNFTTPSLTPIVKRTSYLTSVKTIPTSYYVNTLPFFCKKELQLEKALKFPVKIRMGSVEYTDKMEGKSRTRF